jgi:hypothetical protein
MSEALLQNSSTFRTICVTDRVELQWRHSQRGEICDSLPHVVHCTVKSSIKRAFSVGALLAGAA